MKVIDLLNKIANGEKDEVFTEFEFNDEEYTMVKLQDDYSLDEDILNEEIEIIGEDKKIEIIGEDKKIEIIGEDKKIEKLKYDCIDQDGLGWYKLQTLSDKIDEIIDKINEE